MDLYINRYKVGTCGGSSEGIEVGRAEGTEGKLSKNSEKIEEERVSSEKLFKIVEINVASN